MMAFHSISCVASPAPCRPLANSSVKAFIALLAIARGVEAFWGQRQMVEVEEVMSRYAPCSTLCQRCSLTQSSYCSPLIKRLTLSTRIAIAGCSWLEREDPWWLLPEYCFQMWCWEFLEMQNLTVGGMDGRRAWKWHHFIRCGEVGRLGNWVRHLQQYTIWVYIFKSCSVKKHWYWIMAAIAKKIEIYPDLTPDPASGERRPIVARPRWSSRGAEWSWVTAPLVWMSCYLIPTF